MAQSRGLGNVFRLRNVVHVEDPLFGAKGDGATDDTAAITAALAAANEIILGPKTYVVSQIVVAAGKKIRTAGLNTVLQQKAAGYNDFPIVKVTGGNVHIESLSGQGNIALDTGEWNHVISIIPTAASNNIKLGVIQGTNIRGDVVAMDASAAHQIRGVIIDGIFGTNIYRNCLSIICGEGVRVGFVIGGQVGYRTVDIEPNGASSGACDNIHIGYIRGGHLQLASSNANLIGNVKVDAIDIDTAYQSNSSVAYAGYDTDMGLPVHHFKSLYIGSLSCKGKNWSSIYCAAGNNGGNVHIGRYISSGILCNSPGGTELVADGLSQLKIDYARPGALPTTAKTWLSGTPTPMEVNNVSGSGGRCIQFASRGSKFLNWAWDATGVAGTLCFQTDNCLFEGWNVTAGTKFLDDTSTGCTVSNSTIGSATFAAAGNDHVVIQSIVEGVGVKVGIWDNDFRDNLRIGTYRVWVDADGKVLRKSSDPASDTDGTSVGLGSTQATIGANGAASALTANPVGYAKVRIAGTQFIVPYYNP